MTYHHAAEATEYVSSQLRTIGYWLSAVKCCDYSGVYPFQPLVGLLGCTGYQMASLHTIAENGFTDGMMYDMHRPSYTSESIKYILDYIGEAGKRADDVEYDVLELGAGTGKFTQKFLQFKPKTTRYLATEPMPEFLTTLRTELPGLETRQCRADDIPLPDSSVRAVVVAQAFHWFADDESMQEIWRVLVPMGKLILIWNCKDNSKGWLGQCEGLRTKYCDSHSTHYSAFKWREKLNEFKGFRQNEHLYLPGIKFQGPKSLMVGRFASSSWISSLTEGKRKKALDKINDILNTDPDTRDAKIICMPMLTDLYYYAKC
ncbi:hypothetical protein ScPMuIL_012853 [Solemya velum]